MHVDQDLIDRAVELRPLVARYADESNRDRGQHPEVAGALAAAGLHRLAVPVEVGGLGANPLTTIRVIEEISAADGSAGWTLMLGIEALGVAAGYLPPETTAKILADKPETIMGGGVTPTGTAVPTAGGFRVTGRWPFASGIDNADWWWGGCYVDDGSGRRPRSTVEVLVPVDQLTIHRTWDGSGLAGTGSHDVEIVSRFVPYDRCTSVHQGRPAVDHPYFRMPLLSRFAFNKVGVSTGIARAALDAFVELARSKTPGGERTLLAERPRAQRAIAEAEAALGGGRAWALDIVEELWAEAMAGRPISAELHAMVRLSCSSAAQAAMVAVDRVHSAAGTSANVRHSPLDRCWRDVHTVPQQITVAPHMIETAGRVLLGLAPDLLAF